MDKVTAEGKRYSAATKQYNNVRKRRDILQKKRFEVFKEGFDFISDRLKKVYGQITDSTGDADLEMYDSVDPFTQGISYSVRPPKKGWKTIGKLSGGERTLASLALIFALHYYKPTPIYVMDEIDAALDFQNVDIVGEFIKERSKDAQFIVISLRENMFFKSRKMIGVHKVNNKSGIVTLKMTNLLEKIIHKARQTCKENKESLMSQQFLTQRRMTPNPNSSMRGNVPASARVLKKNINSLNQTQGQIDIKEEEEDQVDENRESQSVHSASKLSSRSQARSTRNFGDHRTRRNAVLPENEGA
jgi:ATPase subunit of ABC transporter with duplicated ATPase domains